MRSVLTLSVPRKKALAIRKKAKKSGLTISAYFLRLVDNEEHLISEEELLQYSKEAEEEYKKGEYVALQTDEDISKFFKARAKK